MLNPADEKNTAETEVKNEISEARSDLMQLIEEDTNWSVHFTLHFLINMWTIENSMGFISWLIGFSVGLIGIGLGCQAIGISIAIEGEREWLILGLGLGFFVFGLVCLIFAGVHLTKLKRKSDAIFIDLMSTIDKRQNDLRDIVNQHK